MPTPHDHVYKSVRWRKLRLEILERDGHRCQVGLKHCKGRATAVDHRLPMSAGGEAFAPSNLRATCRSCNTALSNKPAPPRPSREW